MILKSHILCVHGNFYVHAGGNAPGRDSLEPDARANRDTRDAVQRGDENSQRAADRADHGAAQQVREDRRQERVLLVPEPQSPREAEAEAQQPRPRSLLENTHHGRRDRHCIFEHY